MDVMVHESVESAFSKFQSVIHVADVQQQLDEHEVDRKNTRVPGEFFTDFPTTGEYLVWLNDIINQHSAVARRVSIGETYLGNEIFGIQIGVVSSRYIYIHCGIHAREWISPTTCGWIIDQLLAEDPDRFKLREDFSWIIVPIFNIDGYDVTHTSDRLWRKNRAPNPGSSCVGTDINRNYGYNFGGPGSSANPCDQQYRGSSAFSSPEAATERDFLEPYLVDGSLAVYVDIHSYGALFMSPWGFSVQPPPGYAEMDAQMRSSVAAIYNVNLRSYAFGPIARELYFMSGGTTDWTYGDGGVVQSYIIEAHGTSFTPPASWIVPIGREIYAGVKDIAINFA